jgi:hypothetical protein
MGQQGKNAEGEAPKAIPSLNLMPVAPLSPSWLASPVRADILTGS